MTNKELLLARPGNYDLKKLLLITEKSVIDLRSVFIQMNIYEDLFSFTYSGNMVVTETDNLTGKEKILGGERILIEYDCYTEVDGRVVKLNTSLTAIITKITFETPVTGGMGKNYVIDFVSIDHISNLRKKIFKSFYRKPLHDIVRYAYNLLDSDSKLDLEPSKNMIERVVIPGWNPFKTISWCAEKGVQTKSRNGSSLSSFLWYQTIYNTDDFRQRDVSSYFHFVSIDSLLGKDPKKEILYNIKETHDYKKDIKKYVMAEAFEVVENFDYLKLGLEGAYNSTMFEISFKEKKWRNKRFNYKQHFSSMDHLYDNPFMNDLNDLVLHSKQAQVLFMRDMDTNKFNFARNIRTCQLAFLNNRKIRLLLPGNSFLSVGDVIDYKMPTFEKDYTRNPEGLDPLYSGKYLITSINHNFNPNQYRMSVEAVMETFKK